MVSNEHETSLAHAMSASTAGAKLSVPDGRLTRPGTPVRATRDRPLLSPNGRHLRHLTGIAIRNITSRPAKARRRSNDDDNLHATWRSPGKLAVWGEEKTITHSRSAVDLSTLAAESSAAGAAGGSSGSLGGSLRGEVGGGGGGSSSSAVTDESVSEGGRLSLVRKRRNTRANSILAGTIFEHAATRQKNLVDATLGRLVDCFFTLHHESAGGAWVKPASGCACNPTFQSFELSECGPAITRLDSVIVRVWSRKDPRADFTLLMDLTLNLSYLQFVGRSLDDCKFTFPDNCVIFGLSDGCYTIFSELHPKLLKKFGAPRSTNRSLVFTEVAETCSFDAILKMRNLEDCIYDARETQALLEEQMDATASTKAEYLSHVRALDEENLELKDARKIIARERKRLETLRKHRDALKQSISGRKAAIDAGAENRAVAKKHLHNAKALLGQSVVEANTTTAGIASRRRAILDDLAKIYPIEHIPEQPLNFTICNLHLPNEPPEGHNEDVIAAALGYVAHLVYILSFYLSVYLRYPVIPKGSSSMVHDPISIIQGSRFFPLWAKGVPYFRFEYAMFLLNKNIEQLMESQKCIVLDLRQTLPNLKYLLYVTTASRTQMLSSPRPCSPVVATTAAASPFPPPAPAPTTAAGPAVPTIAILTAPIEERQPPSGSSKVFSLPINRRAAAVAADASGAAGGNSGELLLSRSLPKSTRGFASVSPNGSITRSTISFKRDFRKTQDVL
ncbi:hypothetical protein Dda_2681 [Drechslerella dactyloides]|uniref:Autophagy-related protein 14 n=1 Tax=Drechslerella dactyloides TaxID=74499 RepID=A0AAD6J4C1_DREDA|nr:hypothetical protein Dda_2681 [Drechslerella dactyloides]